MGRPLGWKKLSEIVSKRFRRVFVPTNQDPADIVSKPKPPEVVLRGFGDQEIVMEIRYYVDNARKMRPSKSFFVTEILRRFEEDGVTLAFPVRVNMNSDVDLEGLGF